MVKLTEHSDGDNSLELKSGTETMPKIEDFDYNFPSDNMYSRQIGDNAASTSGSNLRSSFIGMGFSPSLVDKVIEENGEDNIDLLLDTLFAYSAIHKSKLESSDSVGGLISEKKTKLVADCHPEEILWIVCLVMKRIQAAMPILPLIFSQKSNLDCYLSVALTGMKEVSSCGRKAVTLSAALQLIDFSLMCYVVGLNRQPRANNDY